MHYRLGDLIKYRIPGTKKTMRKRVVRDDGETVLVENEEPFWATPQAERPQIKGASIPKNSIVGERPTSGAN